MRKYRIDRYTTLGFLCGALLAAVALISCGGGSSTTSAPTTGTVTTSMTDPATCNGPTGFSHIYVTVTKVTANISASASSTDSGWQTLVDDTSSPMQIDLLSLASPTTVCLLKSLGSSGPLPAGNYQQIRLYLLSNTASGSGTPGSNLCQNSTGWNCVETQSGTFSELQLPSEAQTGIKIPSTNITGGGLTVTAGQSVDLNIDFQSCESIVQEGNGQYRLKPVLFAGEVTQNMNSISGQVVVGNSSGQPVLSSSGAGTPIPGATVLFEQATSGVEVVKDSTTTDPNGNFFVCPLPGAGNYDIVVTAQEQGTVPGTTVTYDPTVAFEVPLGTKLNQIPLVPETASTATTGGAATIAGQVDTSTGTTAISEDVALSPTMSLTPSGGSATSVIIPVFGSLSQPPAVTTSTTTGCATNSDCNNFTLMVPASDANVGTMSNGSITYGVVNASSVTYSLTGSADSCTSATDSSIVVTPDNTGNTPSGTPSNAGTLLLTGCS
jgi:hypothetical protein